MKAVQMASQSADRLVVMKAVCWADCSVYAMVGSWASPLVVMRGDLLAALRAAHSVGMKELTKDVLKAALMVESSVDQ